MTATNTKKMTNIPHLIRNLFENLNFLFFLMESTIEKQDKIIEGNNAHFKKPLRKAKRLHCNNKTMAKLIVLTKMLRGML